MRVLRTFLIILPFVFVSCRTESQYDPVTIFDPNRDPYQDLQHATIEAQRTERYILLDVGGEWCIWCKKLDTFFNENADIKTFLQANYVAMKVNYSPENKNEKFLAQFPKIAGYPHFFVLNEQGQLIHSQETGSLESGDHHDRDKVLAFLKKWIPSRE